MISDLSRLMRPPLSCPPSVAASALPGPRSISRTAIRATVPIHSRSRWYIRRSPRSRSARRRFVKTITQFRPVSIVGAQIARRPRDDPAPHHDVAVVENHRLAGTHGALWSVEDDLGGATLQRAHR